ncbi:MAG: tetratricopeptide repeat protein [Thermoanaerobaculales bacterium]|nr:tetratricopeptide repeat protein [Thermoanaerobaculales bacterium]
MAIPAVTRRGPKAAARAPVALPVVQPRGLRPKRPSRWRTVTLIGVHLAMIAHVAQWLLGGVTLSPIEPSEGMELAKHGVVNTGLAFFVAAIVVTAVVGRFFCGWGCHLVALQDASRWLLRRIGFEPRPLRSRLLGVVPLVAFLYMFVWPAVYRIAVGEPLGPLRTAFLTSDFWATFPGVVVAIITFVVCGFAAVLVLGAKGFCTYGCPYGAAFGAVDRLAPIRIRVTDACRGCATCTSVCTSNVRVHEEVRDHRMVVDPGCMKCLDCVAACPSGALYVGFGAPAVGKGGGTRRGGAAKLADEIVGGVVFVVGFAAFRGLYGAVPFLLALGLAGCLAGLAVVAWRLARRPDVWLGSLRLEAGGRLRPAGRAVVAVSAVAAIVVVHSLAVQALGVVSRARFEATAPVRHRALDLSGAFAPASEEERHLVSRADLAESWLDRLSPVEIAGSDQRRAWLAALSGRTAEAERLVDRALVRRPDDPQSHLLAARLLVARGRDDLAVAAYSRVVELAPGTADGYLGLGTVYARNGRLSEAAQVFARGLTASPGSLDLRYNLGLATAMTGDLGAAIGHFQAVVAADPEHRPARENLAGALAAAGRFDEAVAAFDEAIRRSPDDPELRRLAARACLAAGRSEEAELHLAAAERIEAGRATSPNSG